MKKKKFYCAVQRYLFHFYVDLKYHTLTTVSNTVSTKLLSQSDNNTAPVAYSFFKLKILESTNLKKEIETINVRNTFFRQEQSILCKYLLSAPYFKNVETAMHSNYSAMYSNRFFYVNSRILYVSNQINKIIYFQNCCPLYLVRAHDILVKQHLVYQSLSKTRNFRFLPITNSPNREATKKRVLFKLLAQEICYYQNWFNEWSQYCPFRQSGKCLSQHQNQSLLSRATWRLSGFLKLSLLVKNARSIETNVNKVNNFLVDWMVQSTLPTCFKSASRFKLLLYIKQKRKVIPKKQFFNFYSLKLKVAKNQIFQNTLNPGKPEARRIEILKKKILLGAHFFLFCCVLTTYKNDKIVPTNQNLFFQKQRIRRLIVFLKWPFQSDYRVLRLTKLIAVKHVKIKNNFVFCKPFSRKKTLETWTRVHLIKGVSFNCFVLARPLLTLTRLDSFFICESLKLPIYPDKSNGQLQFLRNRVRKQILPTIRILLNPQFETLFCKFSESYK